MTRSEQLAQLAGRDLELDCADYGGLQQLMQRLYEQLLVRNTVQIEALNRQIQWLLDCIRARAERRSKILTAFNLVPTSSAAMKTMLAICPLPERDAYLRCWHELENLVPQTKSLNERNGKLLAMHSEILSQLMGDNAVQLYSPRYY